MAAETEQNDELKENIEAHIPSNTPKSTLQQDNQKDKSSEDKPANDENTTTESVANPDSNGTISSQNINHTDKTISKSDSNSIGECSNEELSAESQTGIENKDDAQSDEGDPIPSGTGHVSRECSVSELVGWSEILPKWHAKLDKRPKGLESLVRRGIPEPLRGEVWQLLSGAHQSADLMEQYRIYLTRTPAAEQIILRDVHRTYPAHDNFRTDSGSSSLLDSLFKVCKAYAVYDAEVGYCQGLSFLVAALLLHMPEEQAFCVFVRIMQHYGLRNLFRHNFDELYLKFYQLEHLLEDHMADLHAHFKRIGIEPFTYASQWFLTVFTAKFPLNAVFYILDIFLLDGMDTIFQVALALLSASRQELLALDFEGVLKYFRVQMPKRYRSQENVQQLISVASDMSLRRLKKHAKAYEALKQKEKMLENPLTRLQRENTKLTENNLRLEQENDDLARDLVSSKIGLRAQLDALEDKGDQLGRALANANQECKNHLATISDMEDERARLEVEVTQLKEVCRRELNRAETELARDNNIITDYKQICSRLGKRIEAKLRLVEKFCESTQYALGDNQKCKDKSCARLFKTTSEQMLRALKSEDDGEPNDDTAEHKATQGKKEPASKSTKQTKRKATANSINNNNTTASNNEAEPNKLGAWVKGDDDDEQQERRGAGSQEVKIRMLSEHVNALEIELARTKLALVEAECKCQQLTHDLTTSASPSVGVLRPQPSLAAASSSLSSFAAGKLDFMKQAVTSTASRRSPKAASALAKINNLIAERVVGSPAHAMTSSATSPQISNSAHSSPSPSQRSSTVETPNVPTAIQDSNRC